MTRTASKTIGGYLELELSHRMRDIIHRDALGLNSGRSCLALVLSQGGVRALYLPFFLCDSIIDLVAATNVEIKFYSLDKNLEIKDSPILETDERILYVNYFGLKQKYAESLEKCFGAALIVDNSQAFYATRIPGIDTFYSPRKFFGVSDGGYLYSDKNLDAEPPIARSAESSLHLLGRLDDGAEPWFAAYQRAEAHLSKQGVMRMSNLTRSVLGSIDYKAVRQCREENYDYLHSILGPLNSLQPAHQRGLGPMVYPLLSKTKGLRDHLQRNKVYVATYWREVTLRQNASKWEKTLAQECVPLPIDQRYDVADMRRVVRVVEEVLDG